MVLETDQNTFSSYKSAKIEEYEIEVELNFDEEVLIIIIIIFFYFYFSILGIYLCNNCSRKFLEKPNIKSLH